MKKLTLIICAVFVAGFIFSACSKSPVGPSMSSMLIGANGASSSSSSSTICVTSNSGGSTAVNTQQTSTVSTQTGDTGVTSVDVSTGVSSGISGGDSSTGTSGNTGSALSVTIYSTLSAATAGLQSITISTSTIPTFSLNYSGIAGTNIWFMVNDSNTAHYMNVSVPSLPTSIRFGVTPTGGTEVVASKALIAGTYSVVVMVLDDSSNMLGYGAGAIVVQ